MAITHLPTNFVDAVTSEQKYQVTDVGNNQALFHDVSDYTVDGSYFGAREINAQHETVNEVITSAENTDNALTRLMNGTTILESVTHADTVQSAETAETATSVTSATSADYAESVTSATSADRVTTANSLSNAHAINGVTFDGTQNITITDDTRLPLSKSFILVAGQALSFTDKVCEITDSRITANSLANVEFTADCIDNAIMAMISVETSSNTVTLTAGRNITGTLTATIYIRVVE